MKYLIFPLFLLLFACNTDDEAQPNTDFVDLELSEQLQYQDWHFYGTQCNTTVNTQNITYSFTSDKVTITGISTGPLEYDYWIEGINDVMYKPSSVAEASGLMRVLNVTESIIRAIPLHLDQSLECQSFYFAEVEDMAVGSTENYESILDNQYEIPQAGFKRFYTFNSDSIRVISYVGNTNEVLQQFSRAWSMEDDRTITAIDTNGNPFEWFKLLVNENGDWHAASLTGQEEKEYVFFDRQN